MKTKPIFQFKAFLAATRIIDNAIDSKTPLAACLKSLIRSRSIPADCKKKAVKMAERHYAR